MSEIRALPEPGIVDGEVRELAVPGQHGIQPKRAVLVPRNPDDPVWACLMGEPVAWYVRFEMYRRLGPERTLFRAYCDFRAEHPPAGVPAFVPDRHRTVPQKWRKAFNYWRWKIRAEAWDAHVVDELREQELARIKAANEERLQSGKALRALGIAEVAHMHRSRRGQLKPMEAIMAVKVGDEIIAKSMGLEAEGNKADSSGPGYSVKVLEGVDQDAL